MDGMNDSPKTARRSLIKGLLGILALLALIAIDVVLLPQDAPVVHVVSGEIRYVR